MGWFCLERVVKLLRRLQCFYRVLSQEGNSALMLNVDWFTFNYSYGSLGIVYLAVLNLPRDIRFQLENVIVVGIIPGPREPILTCNTHGL